MDSDATARSWTPIGTGTFSAATALLVMGVWMYRSSGGEWIRVLDDANLVFHEAGHPLFGLAGSTLGLYGGTLGQLAFPVLCAGQFWFRRQSASFALSLCWLFENFFNIARYMADARAQVLPLVGSGDHDWARIFTNWHVLSHDTSIASGVRFLGMMGLLSAWGWLAWRCYEDRGQSG